MNIFRTLWDNVGWNVHRPFQKTPSNSCWWQVWRWTDFPCRITNITMSRNVFVTRMVIKSFSHSGHFKVRSDFCYWQIEFIPLQWRVAEQEEKVILLSLHNIVEVGRIIGLLSVVKRRPSWWACHGYREKRTWYDKYHDRFLHLYNAGHWLLVMMMTMM